MPKGYIIPAKCLPMQIAVLLPPLASADSYYERTEAQAQATLAGQANAPRNSYIRLLMASARLCCGAELQALQLRHISSEYTTHFTKNRYSTIIFLL